MIEQWKTWKETNSRYGYRIYDISNFGNVLVNCEPYECKIHNGYKYLCSKPLHRIVAQLFINNYNPKLEIDHIDTNKLNNRVDNLRMCTPKENSNNPITKKHMSENHHDISGINNPNYGGLSEEHKRKLSESHKGKTPWNKNKSWNDETKQKISLNTIKYFWNKNKIYYDNHYIVVYKSNATKVIYTEFLEDAAKYLNVTSLEICAAMFSGVKIKGWTIKPVDGNNPYEGDEPWHVKINRDNNDKFTKNK